MSFIKIAMPMPALKRLSNAGSSKYDFAGLQEGEALIEADVVNAGKVAGRLTSAISSYRKRSGDKRKFSVRTFKNDAGQDCVGVWATAPADNAA